MLEVKGITKIYGNKKVLDNVSLTIKKYSITSFIGPNGAGKSTLLNIMNKMIKMSKGDIFLDGISLKNYKEEDRAKKVAILKQNNNILLKLTIRELVEFGRYPHSKGKLNDVDIEKINQALIYMNLKNIENKYIDELSGGQRQRAFIAMVLAQDTEYILLDEPLNNLDMKHSVEIMRLLKKLCKDLKKTVVIVIHDINFASCYSDYIVALKDGKLIIDNSTKEVMQKKVLESVYDIQMKIQEINGNRICVYYDEK